MTKKRESVTKIDYTKGELSQGVLSQTNGTQIAQGNYTHILMYGVGAIASALVTYLCYYLANLGAHNAAQDNRDHPQRDSRDDNDEDDDKDKKDSDFQDPLNNRAKLNAGQNPHADESTSEIITAVNEAGWKPSGDTTDNHLEITLDIHKIDISLLGSDQNLEFFYGKAKSMASILVIYLRYYFANLGAHNSALDNHDYLQHDSRNDDKVNKASNFQELLNNRLKLNAGHNPHANESTSEIITAVNEVGWESLGLIDNHLENILDIREMNISTLGNNQNLGFHHDEVGLIFA